jgi:hypothetical protein
MSKDDITEYNECDLCIHKRTVPGNTHIAYTKPDPKMTGDSHGIRKGWFIYPILFDPIWKTKMCNNRKTKDE